MRRILSALGLFFLSPLVAEFLLGDLPITALFALIALAPLYGGGALLIREVCRRAGWGWPSMLALALAYGVLEEGVCTQSLFNPDYAGVHLLANGYIPALGIAGPWTLFVLTLHVVWSIGTPIALVELATRERRTSPWLGRVGLGVTAALFVAGVLVTTAQSLAQSDFVASVPQFIVVAVVVLGLVAVAFFLGRRHGHAGPMYGRTPPAWLLGLLSFAVTSAFVTVWFVAHGTLPPWVFVAAGLTAYVVAGVLAYRWSRQPGWTPMHQLALAGGTLLTYAWHGFEAPLLLPASPTVKLVGNIVFAVGAVVLLAVLTRVTYRRSRRQELSTPPDVHAAPPAG